MRMETVSWREEKEIRRYPNVNISQLHLPDVARLRCNEEHHASSIIHTVVNCIYLCHVIDFFENPMHYINLVTLINLSRRICTNFSSMSVFIPVHSDPDKYQI